MSKPMEWPRYQLEIDEEGFPLFDGIRIDDVDFIKGLFQNFYLVDEKNPYSALMSQCEGENVLVKAFESPLVAQSVEAVNNEKSEWVFPGGMVFSVKHADLGVDEWNRVRAEIGPLKIFASLSRKAQAAFGSRLSEMNLTLDLSPWYLEKTDERVENAEFWNQAYLRKKDGWEMREASPVLVHGWKEFRQKSQLKNGKAVVLGAGRGHDARFVELNSSLEVTAVDFSNEAKTEFHKSYPDTRILYVCESAFDYLERNLKSFDVLVEHTFFCAISPQERRRYFQAVEHSLKEGGFLVGVFWMRPSRRGPPFGFTPWELRESLCKSNLEIIDFRLSPFSWENRWGQEYFVVLRKGKS